MHLFDVSARGSSVRTEILGGISTFLAVAYIIVVNPAILKAAGLPVGASTVATICVAAAGTLLMGLYANRPIAVAPYMGENAFIAFGLAALGVTWQQRLGAVFLGGLLFLVISLVGLRAWLANAISPSLPFTYNIANGLTAGLVLHPLMKLLAGRWREVRTGSVALALLCVVYYAFGLPH
jgi:AGZA family xanthine/uracil permease-like MFS transporter